MPAVERSGLTPLQKAALKKPLIAQTRERIAREWNNENLSMCPVQMWLGEALDSLLADSSSVDEAVQAWKKENTRRLNMQGEVREDRPVQPEEFLISKEEIIPRGVRRSSELLTADSRGTLWRR